MQNICGTSMARFISLNRSMYYVKIHGYNATVLPNLHLTEQAVWLSVAVINEVFSDLVI